MHQRTPLPLDRQFASALDWWREAGVDLTFEDEPRDWLRPSTPAPPAADAREVKGGAKPAIAPAPPLLGGDRAHWPQDLAGWHHWWLAEPSLDTGGNLPRVAPRGAAGAELMVLVPMPEPGDRELLLSGREGMLVSNMFAAMGLGEEQTYLAAALPCHMSEPDWPGLERNGLGTVLLHHLSLARPKRLLVLGRSILPLLGHDPAQAPAIVSETSILCGEAHEMVPTLVGVAPGLLLENARQRAMLWRRWLDWTDADR